MIFFKRHELDNLSSSPIISATIKQCRTLTDSLDTIALIHSLIDEYLTQLVANTQLYFSKEFGATFPYTVVKLSDIAVTLYQKMGIRERDRINQNDYITTENGSPRFIYREPSRPQKEFIFGTSFSIRSGHPYHWIEHGIDQIAKKLPVALIDLSRGDIPQDFEIYGIGNPAGELGSLSDQCLMQAREQPFEYLGVLYAEFINSLQHQNSADCRSPLIRLWGVSMGATIASTTAHSLIQKKQATQSFRGAAQYCIPLVRVFMLVPVAINGREVSKKLQLKGGFIAEIVCQALMNTYGREVGNAEHEFISVIHHKLLDRGIEPRISEVDIRIKSQLINKLINQLLEGTSIPIELKTNEVIGIYDPLVYTWGNQKVARTHHDRACGSLGANIVPSSEKCRRRFAIKMTHTPAVIRRNYFKRLIKAAEIIQEQILDIKQKS